MTQSRLINAPRPPAGPEGGGFMPGFRGVLGILEVLGVFQALSLSALSL